MLCRLKPYREWIATVPLSAMNFIRESGGPRVVYARFILTIAEILLGEDDPETRKIRACLP